VVGGAHGVSAVYLAGKLMRGVLVGVSPWDPVTLIDATLGLGLVTIGACYVPARRVLGIDPARSLREE